MYFSVWSNIYHRKFAILKSRQLSGINYIHKVVQPSALVPKSFHHPKQKLCNPVKQ